MAREMKSPLVAQTKHMHHLIVWKMDWESHQHTIHADMLTTAYDPYQAAKRTAEALRLSEAQWNGTKPPYIIRYEGVYLHDSADRNTGSRLHRYSRGWMARGRMARGDPDMSFLDLERRTKCLP